MTFSTYVNEKFKPVMKENEADEEKLKQTNIDLSAKKIKAIQDICENGNPGFKFRKQFEDMKGKLRLHEKVIQDYGIKVKEEKKEEIKKAV